MKKGDEADEQGEVIKYEITVGVITWVVVTLVVGVWVGLRLIIANARRKASRIKG